MEISRLTRDGTAEPVSRDQILRHARGQGNIHFSYSADHEQDWQPYPVDPYSAICDDHTYIHTYIFPNACDRYIATNISSLSQHSSRDTSKYYALSNDERPAAALTSPVTLIHPPIYMSGKLSKVAS